MKNDCECILLSLYLTYICIEFVSGQKVTHWSGERSIHKSVFSLCSMNLKFTVFCVLLFIFVAYLKNCRVLLMIKKQGNSVTILVNLGHISESLMDRKKEYRFFLSLCLQTIKPVVPAHSKPKSLDQSESYTFKLRV